MMAPHLLQWAAIKITKQLGYKYYDFWGIAPSDQPNHPWSGISRFKRGLGRNKKPTISKGRLLSETSSAS